MLLPAFDLPPAFLQVTKKAVPLSRHTHRETFNKGALLRGQNTDRWPFPFVCMALGASQVQLGLDFKLTATPPTTHAGAFVSG